MASKPTHIVKGIGPGGYTYSIADELLEGEVSVVRNYASLFALPDHIIESGVIQFHACPDCLRVAKAIYGVR